MEIIKNDDTFSSQISQVIMIFILKNLLQELYEMIEEGIQSILICKAEIEDMINENLMKFENDERLIKMNERMKEIFKDPYIPEYKSSSESERDDDEDDNSQVGDENDQSYGTQTNSGEEDNVEIVTEAEQEEILNEENDEKGVSQSEDELMNDEHTERIEKEDEQ